MINSCDEKTATDQGILAYCRRMIKRDLDKCRDRRGSMRSACKGQVSFQGMVREGKG